MAYVEFPRHMHKPGVEALVVHDELAKQAAIDAGWSLTPVINGHVIDFDEDAAEPDAPDVEVVVEKKRGRPKKVN